jgi:heme A synthase
VILSLHDLFSRALVLYFLIVGLWALYLAIRRQPFNSALQGALIISLVLGVVQALLGVLLLVTGSSRPRDDLHYLYGLSIIVALPLVQQYMSKRTVSRNLAYGLASLFMAGLAIRAITTGA